jgi:hypothetical protein
MDISAGAKSDHIVIPTGAQRSGEICCLSYFERREAPLNQQQRSRTQPAYFFEWPIANRIPARKVNGSDGYPIGPMC